MALQMDGQYFWNVMSRFGFGKVTGSGFPGESAGVLRTFQHWRPLEQATLSYGYGLSVTPLQLAQAYGALADQGRLHQPTLILGADNPTVSFIDPAIAQQVGRDAGNRANGRRYGTPRTGGDVQGRRQDRHFT